MRPKFLFPRTGKVQNKSIPGKTPLTGSQSGVLEAIPPPSLSQPHGQPTRSCQRCSTIYLEPSIVNQPKFPKSPRALVNHEGTHNPEDRANQSRERKVKDTHSYHRMLYIDHAKSTLLSSIPMYGGPLHTGSLQSKCSLLLHTV